MRQCPGCLSPIEEGEEFSILGYPKDNPVICHRSVECVYSAMIDSGSNIFRIKANCLGCGKPIRSKTAFVLESDNLSHDTLECLIESLKKETGE